MIGLEEPLFGEINIKTTNGHLCPDTNYRNLYQEALFWQTRSFCTWKKFSNINNVLIIFAKKCLVSKRLFQQL